MPVLRSNLPADNLPAGTGLGCRIRPFDRCLAELARRVRVFAALPGVGPPEHDD
jgi:hypothetical protein